MSLISVMILKATLFILTGLFLGINAVDHMDHVVNSILQSYLHPAEKCLLLNIGRKVQLFSFEHQSIVYNYTEMNNLIDVIAMENSCAILIYGGEDNGSEFSYNMSKSVLQKDNNLFDRRDILEHYLCTSNNSTVETMTHMTNSKCKASSHNVLSSNVKLIQGAAKNLAIQIRGEAPFASNEFDSSRPMLYINEDNSFVYIYLYCPNVTEGSLYKKWSLANIWNKEKFNYTLPLAGSIYQCPHSLHNQTLFIGYWKTKGINEREQLFFDDFARFYKVKKVIKYCAPYSYSLHNLTAGTYEWLVWHGMADFAASNYQIRPSIPFHYIYSTYTLKYYFLTRIPIVTSAWKNIITVFHIYVWLLILVSLAILGLTFLVIFKFYKHLLPHANLTTQSDRDTFEFFLRTYASITEPDPLPWFTPKAISGRIVIALWILSCLILNQAFTSNLRATLLRPNTEKPLNTLQDAIDRGQNIWFQHLVPDASKPDVIDTSGLKRMVNPAILEYIKQHGMTTYALKTESVFLPKYVIKDMMDNGASIIYAEFAHGRPIKNLIKAGIYVRLGKENIIKNLIHHSFLIQKYKPWRSDIDYLIMLMSQTGLTQKHNQVFEDNKDQSYYKLDVSLERDMIGLEHCLLPFLMLITGLLLAVLEWFIWERSS